MTNKFKVLLLSVFCVSQLNAQTDTDIPADRYISPLELNLQQETVEVEYFALQLAKLKAAFAEKDASNIIVLESAVLMALRNEMNQLELKLAGVAQQATRRKSASSGTINSAETPVETPARDPFAEATTADEKRFETMQYTLAAFQRHSFDPSEPEAAAKDFEKLDKIQVIMEEALAELKGIRE